jgi:hypothetical protein
VTQPIELQVVQLQGDTLLTVLDQGNVVLENAPQGGYVAYVAVKAKNVHRCGLNLSASLGAVDGGTQTSFDGRDIDTEEQAGFAVPLGLLPSNASNLVPCPNFHDYPVINVPLKLSVQVKDSDGRTASQQLTVTIRCPSSNQDCALNCAPQISTEDAGPDLDAGP